MLGWRTLRVVHAFFFFFVKAVLGGGPRLGEGWIFARVGMFCGGWLDVERLGKWGFLHSIDCPSIGRRAVSRGAGDAVVFGVVGALGIRRIRSDANSIVELVRREGKTNQGTCLSVCLSDQIPNSAFVPFGHMMSLVLSEF